MNRIFLYLYFISNQAVKVCKKHENCLICVYLHTVNIYKHYIHEMYRNEICLCKTKEFLQQNAIKHSILLENLVESSL